MNTTEDLRRQGRRTPAGAWLGGPAGLALVATALLIAGLVVGVLLGRSTSDGPGTPGLSGRAAPGGAPRARPVADEIEARRKEVEPSDAPTKKLLTFAHLALDEGQTPAAIWAYKRVLAREPKNVEALTHMGIVFYQGNHVDEALARLEEALALDPNYAHAHWDRAHILFHGRKDYAAAVRALEAFIALVPTGEDAERARAMLIEARTRMGGGGRSERPAPPPAAVLPAAAAAARPLPPEQFTGKAAQAYRVAHVIGDSLAQLTCYCGCDVTAGHRNLRACFLDAHGST